LLGVQVQKLSSLPWQGLRAANSGGSRISRWKKNVRQHPM